MKGKTDNKGHTDNLNGGHGKADNLGHSDNIKESILEKQTIQDMLTYIYKIYVHEDNMNNKIHLN